ncbi:ABC transporter permease [Virgibacillus necropolis]|uniref:ABC transporter permease n=1 Tax=Virgibacillus necropolis TaxID=163877 RepID=UPI00384CAB21
MFLAFKELKRSKLRYTLLGLIMVAILFLLFFITGLANGLSYADSSSLENLATEYAIIDEESDGAIINSELAPEQADTIQKKLDDKSSPLAITMSELVGEQDDKIGVVYFSVNTEKYPNMGVLEGKDISELSGNEVIVSESLKKDGYELGDKIEDKTSGKTMTIAGFIEKQTYTFLPVIYADFELGMHKIFTDKPSYNAIVYTGSKVTIEEYDTMTKEELVKSMPGYTETQGSFMVMKLFMFIISGFVSTVFFYVITIQKTSQFGVLKAVGANTKYIAKSIMIQVVLLTVISLVFSVLAITGMVQVLPEGMPFKTSAALILSTGALFLGLNLAGSLLSVFKVTKIDALEAIGKVE